MSSFSVEWAIPLPEVTKCIVDAKLRHSEMATVVASITNTLIKNSTTDEDVSLAMIHKRLDDCGLELNYTTFIEVAEVISNEIVKQLKATTPESVINLVKVYEHPCKINILITSKLQ